MDMHTANLINNWTRMTFELGNTSMNGFNEAENFRVVSLFRGVGYFCIWLFIKYSNLVFVGKLVNSNGFLLKIVFFLFL